MVNDPELLELAEVDFSSEYPGLKFRGLWTGSLTIREAAVHLWHLPLKSRLKQQLSEGGVIWDQADHHRQDLTDLLQLVLYYTTVAATKGIEKRSDIDRLHRGAPKRSLRPGEKKEKPKFTSKADLQKMFGRRAR